MTFKTDKANAIATDARKFGVQAVSMQKAIDGLAGSDKANAAFYAAALNATATVTMIAAVKVGRAMNAGEYKAGAGEGETAKAAWSDAWRTMKARAAYQGVGCFRDSDAFESQIRIIRTHETRVKMVQSYLKDGKGRKVKEGFAKVSKLGRAIVAHASTNYADTLRHMAQMNADDARADYWARFIADTYGDTYSAVESALSEEKSEQDKPDVWARMAKLIGKAALTDADALLRIAALATTRAAELQADAAALSDAIGADDSDETDDELQEEAA
ncbi:MAG: hypothetical protein KDK08_05565 [Rhizobiaceae bacterium]|nr:hypothetical protein [Rhizobiaceae bacterium]